MQKTVSANSKGIQRINRLRVLDLIRSGNLVARSAICERTGLSAASVSNIVSYLIENGLVKEANCENVSRSGRKSVLLRFAVENYRLITVSHIGSMLHIFLTDLAGEVFAHMEYRMQDLAPEAITELLYGGIQEMFCSPQGKTAIGVGIFLSAMVLDEGRQVISATLQWDVPEIRRRLTEIIDMPLYISNSTFTKGLWFCRRSAENNSGLSLFIDIAQGMGAALIQDGVRIPQVIGEIGHTTVARDGDACTCGNHGCLEAMCSPARMLQLYARESGQPLQQLKSLTRLAEAGDRKALSAIDDCAEYLGIGLANLVSLFNPNEMVINAADYVHCPRVVEKALAVMQKRILPGLASHMTIRSVLFNESDLPRAIAWELCGAMFSETFPEDVFDRIEKMACAH
ncbi:MAG: ROK family transcriptional regulator [Clostridiales bacterium]|nr:ROK family transcriptional regulator [Clostridiales bacterium]